MNWFGQPQVERSQNYLNWLGQPCLVLAECCPARSELAAHVSRTSGEQKEKRERERERKRERERERGREGGKKPRGIAPGVRA